MEGIFNLLPDIVRHFLYCPHMTCNSRFHRGGSAQGLVDTNKVVPREVQRQHCVKLLPLLR